MSFYMRSLYLIALVSSMSFIFSLMFSTLIEVNADKELPFFGGGRLHEHFGVTPAHVSLGLKLDGERSK